MGGGRIYTDSTAYVNDREETVGFAVSCGIPEDLAREEFDLDFELVDEENLWDHRLAFVTNG